MSRWLRSFLLLVATCLSLTSAVAAEPTERRRVITPVNQRLLEVFHDKFSFPKTPLAADDSVALIVVDGVTADIMLVGPRRKSSRAYGKSLETLRAALGLEGTVEYGTEDTSSAAQLEMSVARFGATTATLNLDVATIRREILKLEPQARIGLCFIPGSDLKWPILPGGSSARGALYWDLTTPPKTAERLVSTVKVPNASRAGVLAWAAWLPFCAVCLLIYCWWLARRPGVPRRELRWQHTKAVRTTVTAALALLGVVSLLFLPKSLFEPVLMAWLGRRYPSGALGLFMLSGLASILILIAVNQLREVSYPETAGASPYFSRSLARKRKWTANILFVVLLTAYFSLDPVLGWRGTGNWLLLGMIMFGSAVCDVVAKKLHPYVVPDEIKALAEERGLKLNRAVYGIDRLYPLKYHVTLNKAERDSSTPVAFIRPNHLYIALEPADMLTSDEIVYLFAREIEISQIKAPIWMPLTIFPMFAILLFVLVATKDIGITLLALSLAVGLSCFVIFPQYEIRKVIRSAVGSANAAARIGDPALAMSTLRKLVFEVQRATPDSQRAALLTAELAATEKIAKSDGTAQPTQAND